jgi:hypothetical protein
MENPKCSNCKKEWKPDDTDIKKNGEVCKRCKKCRDKSKNYKSKNRENIAKQSREYYENNKDKLLEKNKKYRKDNKEKMTEYRKNNKVKITEYKENNKEKTAEYYKVYRKKNREKLAKKDKEYYENNKEKYAKYIKEYYENNKEKYAKYRKEYRETNKEQLVERRKEYLENSKCEHNKLYGKCKICNLSMYLVNLNRNAVRRCLKVSFINKKKSSIKYLGCDVEYFIDYFKKKMDLWNENNEIKMNWDNIHLDHIKPVSVFNLDEEYELNNCCNYTNFQPLLIEDNLRKKNKWTDEDDVYWNENIKGKEHFEIYISK